MFKLKLIRLITIFKNHMIKTDLKKTIKAMNN